MHPSLKRAIVTFVLAVSPSAWGFITELPPSLAPQILSETVPTAFSGFDLKAEDYVVEWLGTPMVPADIQLRLIPETVQWVRVSDVLALPRARLSVEVKGAQSGRVTHAGFTQELSKAGDGALVLRAELPVALISGERNPIDVSFSKDGKTLTARAMLRFVPRESIGNDRVFYDASCSRFKVEASGSAQSAKARGWAYVGCRLAEAKGDGHKTTSLEAWVFWDGVGQSLLIGGVETPSTSVSVWPLRLRSEPGSIQLAVPGGGDELRLSYRTAEYYHRGFLGLGLGPYWYNFTGNGESISRPAPVLTIYGSYFVTETLRGVLFDATTIGPQMTSDIGAYLSTEYTRFFDRRIVINLLLGGHAIGFISKDHYSLAFSIPQGVEVIYKDFIARGFDFNAGFFLYPLIDGVSYYNVWLRWGKGPVFGEFNYIAWDQPIGGQAYHSDSGGISVGFPLARFF